jgi:hypothetical protein
MVESFRVVEFELLMSLSPAGLSIAYLDILWFYSCACLLNWSLLCGLSNLCKVKTCGYEQALRLCLKESYVVINNKCSYCTFFLHQACFSCTFIFYLFLEMAVIAEYVAETVKTALVRETTILKLFDTARGARDRKVNVHFILSAHFHSI